jgi:hypothetical protein
MSERRMLLLVVWVLWTNSLSPGSRADAVWEPSSAYKFCIYPLCQLGGVPAY